jgi:glycerol-1-phosphate dehydrogenase [NAD(P)+]
LRQADCPTEPEHIGVSRDRLRQSYEQAYYIRRRYTVLDFAMRCGGFDSALDELFGPGGAGARPAADRRD